MSIEVEVQECDLSVLRLTGILYEETVPKPLE